MKRRTKEEALGIEEKRAMREREAEDRKKAIARAVEDVLSGAVTSGRQAARNRGAPIADVERAVAEARKAKAAG